MSVCSEYFDGETEGIYLRARYYSPVSGRFITEDPIMDGLNWYIYCYANPIKCQDYTGLKPGDEYRDTEDLVVVRREIVNIIACKAAWGATDDTALKKQYSEWANNARYAINSFFDNEPMWKDLEQLCRIASWDSTGSTYSIEEISALLVVIQYCIDEITAYRGDDLSYDKLKKVYDSAVKENTVYYTTSPEVSTDMYTIGEW